MQINKIYYNYKDNFAYIDFYSSIINSLIENTNKNGRKFQLRFSNTVAEAAGRTKEEHHCNVRRLPSKGTCRDIGQ